MVASVRACCERWGYRAVKPTGLYGNRHKPQERSSWYWIASRRSDWTSWPANLQACPQATLGF